MAAELRVVPLILGGPEGAKKSQEYLFSANPPRMRAAGFQTCCIAGFQAGTAPLRPAGLETCGTADLEVCATPNRYSQEIGFFFLTKRRGKAKKPAVMKLHHPFSAGTPPGATPPLSRRERQIMDAVYCKGEATATDVLERISEPPTRTAVRTLLRILEDKGHLKHIKRGREFVYQPTHSRASAGKSAFARAIRTFFDGSLERAVAAYLGDPGAEVAPEELRRLSTLIAQARRKEREP
jgi:predicted transcriptional regulator